MILTKQTVSKDLASAAASEVTAKSALAPGGLFWNSQCGRKKSNQEPFYNGHTVQIHCCCWSKKSFRLKKKRFCSKNLYACMEVRPAEGRPHPLFGEEVVEFDRLRLGEGGDEVAAEARWVAA